MSFEALLGSATRTASGNALVVRNVSSVVAATFLLAVTDAQAAGADTLDLYLQSSLDGGTTWDDFVHFTQVLGNAVEPIKHIATWTALSGLPESEMHVPADKTLAAGVLQGLVGNDWRVAWVIVGGTASFTFSLSGRLLRHQGRS